MYGVGVCWKCGGWIFSVYKRVGDAYPTLKVKKLERVGGPQKLAVNFPSEEVGVVGRSGKT